MCDHFQELRRKLRSIYKILNAESVITRPIENGLSTFCSELPEYFKDKENSDTYRDHIQKLFEYLENYLKNKPINKRSNIINGPLVVLINDVISLNNDLPIWYSVLVLENVLRLYQFEKLLPKIFLSMWNDKSSCRQIALVKVIAKHMNISIVQQYIKKTCNAELEQLFNEVCSEENNDMAARLFINKFNRFADNIISFFCETIEISRNILIRNQWIDFSKKRRKLSFLCPRKYLSDNDFEDEESDIITITLFSIGHLKLKRDDKQNFAELIVDLNEPCTGLLESSTKFLQNYKTINFKVSKDIEEFRSFIVEFFKIKQTTTSQDLESDIEYFRPSETFSDGLTDEDNVVRSTASPRSSNSDEFIVVDSPYIQRNRSSPNISVQETEYDSIETQSVYSNSENNLTTSALLATPKIRNTCVSVAETVASQTSDSNVRKTCKASSLEAANGEKKSGIPRNVAKIQMLTIRTPEVINSLQELHESENDDKRIIKRRLTTITNTIASDIEIGTNFEGSMIELSSQSSKETENQNVNVFEKNQMSPNNEKLLERVTNSDIVSIIPDGVIQNNCTQTFSQSKNDSPRSCTATQASRTSTKSTPKKKRKRRMSNISPGPEFKSTSFYSSSYKSEGKEIRTRTRVIKKPDFYASETESPRKRRKPKKSTAGSPLSQLSMHSEPPKKRIKTILPVVRVASSMNSTPVTKNILSSTTHSLNISSNDRHIDQNHGMDLFDRVKYGVSSERLPAVRNLNFSSCSQYSPQQDNTAPVRNLNFTSTPQQNINPESPISISSSPISPESNKTSRSEKNNNEKKKGPGRRKKTSPEIPDFVFTSLSESSPEKPKAKGKKSNLENNNSGEKKKRGRKPKSKAVGALQEKVPKKPRRKRKDEGTLNPELNFAISQNEVSKEELDRNDKLLETQYNHVKQIIQSTLLFPSRNHLKMVTQLYNFVRDLKKVITVKK